ncbi:NADH pyrophosphatase-like, NUDIX hydrolase domain-like protein [Artemisia annua]|uniref:NADH pyrophosphatase-like, NUDIX hydrolase domain-like protein n=1 Tax=Artemisia annua TaxID=35608 RepID=A0A2U1NF33_ARTAN|nr:NADH pyrophosphatase-like, NUDIX hydrolase domain-like protein [Artemisia annua]
MPCQLMVGFLAYTISFEKNVDKKELEVAIEYIRVNRYAEWMSREDVKRSLAFTEYGKAHKTAASKVDQICKGVRKGLINGQEVIYITQTRNMLESELIRMIPK